MSLAKVEQRGASPSAVAWGATPPVQPYELARESSTMASVTPEGAATADIVSRAQVHDLVVDFYREIVVDDLLAPVFAEVAEVDWAEHIPKLIDYWCRVLLGQPGYAGAILQAHRQVHDIEAFWPEHFDRWYQLWSAAVDRAGCGPTATRAKAHAARIGAVLARKLLAAHWQPSGSDASA